MHFVMPRCLSKGAWTFSSTPRVAYDFNPSTNLMVERLSVAIRKFASNLLENGQQITCKEFVSIDKPRIGSNVPKENNCDRFRLLIPYGGTTLKWEILFNSDEPHFPPDVIFGNNEPDFEPNLEEIPSLQYWNPDDAGSLTSVIRELLEQYKHYQCKLIKKYSQRVMHEFESVQELEVFSSMEVYVHRNAQVSQQQVNFVIELPIDLERLPPYIVNKNLGDDYVTLHVCYEGHDGSTVIPKIFLSPRVEHAFLYTALQFPSWKDGDECLLSYILSVQTYFHEKIDEIIASYERRRDYVSAFLSFYGTSLLEYDAEAFTTISFLMQVENFFCIVTIEVGKNFPEEQPVFIMKSIYHSFSDEPYQAHDDSYPYSPRWSSTEMARRARSYLLTAIPQFKVASMNNRAYHPPGL